MAQTLDRVLALLPYFAPLRPDERVRIAARFTVSELAAGATFSVAAAAPRLLVLVDGEAELRIGDGDPLALFAGDLAGERDVVVGRGADEVLTSRGCTVAVLDRPGFDALLADFPAMAPPWVVELARELKWKNDLVREISLAHAEGIPADQLDAVLRHRRRKLQHHRRGLVRRATASLLRALFTAPGRRPSFWVLCGAALALVAARTVVGLILKEGLQGHLFALIGGGDGGHPIHIHHFNYGLLLVSLVGVLAMWPATRGALRALGFVFGFGLGLIVDEFALLWNLNPDYYQPSSRLAAAVVLIGIAQVVYFRAAYLSLGRRLSGLWRR